VASIKNLATLFVVVTNDKKRIYDFKLVWLLIRSQM